MTKGNIKRVDLELLKAQKQTLVNMAGGDETPLSGTELEHLWGIINLLDDVQDCVEDFGMIGVFKLRNGG
jgi:hypothetical protein